MCLVVTLLVAAGDGLFGFAPLPLQPGGKAPDPRRADDVA
jgi:hypothetical protein